MPKGHGYDEAPKKASGFKMKGYAYPGESPVKQNIPWDKAPKPNTYERRDFYKKHNIAKDETTRIPVSTQIRKGKLNTEITNLGKGKLRKGDKITARQQQVRDRDQSQVQGNLLYLDHPAASWKSKGSGRVRATEKFRRTNPEASTVMDSLQHVGTLSYHGIDPRTGEKYEDKIKK